MTARQFVELETFYMLEPFGVYREELRHGQIMALHHNLNRDTEKQVEPFRAIDFMNYIDCPEIAEPEMTDDELEAYAAQVFGA